MVARRLGHLAVNRSPLVLALPRGGVPVASRVAEAVGGDLDLLLVRKISAPGRPELGVGAVAENGDPIFDDGLLQRLGLTPAALTAETAAACTELARRNAHYRGKRPAPDPADRLTILVDDGVATGCTARAALRWLRARHAGPILLAAPVCSREADHALSTDADAVICLKRPASFTAVAGFYDDFAQLTDADVHRHLLVRVTS